MGYVYDMLSNIVINTLELLFFFCLFRTKRQKLGAVVVIGLLLFLLALPKNMHWAQLFPETPIQLWRLFDLALLILVIFFGQLCVWGGLVKTVYAMVIAKLWGLLYESIVRIMMNRIPRFLPVKVLGATGADDFQVLQVVPKYALMIDTQYLLFVTVAGAILFIVFWSLAKSIQKVMIENRTIWKVLSYVYLVTCVLAIVLQMWGQPESIYGIVWVGIFEAISLVLIHIMWITDHRLSLQRKLILETNAELMNEYVQVFQENLWIMQRLRHDLRFHLDYDADQENDEYRRMLLDYYDHLKMCEYSADMNLNAIFYTFQQRSQKYGIDIDIQVRNLNVAHWDLTDVYMVFLPLGKFMEESIQYTLEHRDADDRPMKATIQGRCVSRQQALIMSIDFVNLGEGRRHRFREWRRLADKVNHLLVKYGGRISAKYENNVMEVVLFWSSKVQPCFETQQIDQSGVVE